MAPSRWEWWAGATLKGGLLRWAWMGKSTQCSSEVDGEGSRHLSQTPSYLRLGEEWHLPALLFLEKYSGHLCPGTDQSILFKLLLLCCLGGII